MKTKNTYNNKIILSVDTSAKNLSLALLKNNKILETQLVTENPDYATYLIPKLDFLLKKTKTSLSEISIIGCNIGPGSFTGLRVGLSFIRTLATELKIKIFQTNSFYICLETFLSLNLISKNFCSVIVLLPAVRTEVYYKKFILKNNYIIKSYKETCLKIHELKFSKKDFVIGNIEDNNILENLQKKNFFKISPSAKGIIKIFQKSNFFNFTTAKKLSPLYIRHTYY